jgi:hypothetical protein
MLVTRRFETEQNHWSSKFKAAFDKPTSPRMSSYDGPLSTQPDWQGHYSFLPPVESNIFGQSFEHASSSTNDIDVASQHRSSNAQNATPDPHSQTSSGTLSSPASHGRALDPLGLREPKTEPAAQDQSSLSGTNYAIKTENVHEEPLTSSTETTQLSVETNRPVSVPPVQHNDHSRPAVGGTEKVIVEKDEDDEVIEDDDMIEGDGDLEGDGEDEMPSHPQTAAERTAARRKMKRFR